MTLNTDVWIHDPIDPLAVVFKCRHLLGVEEVRHGPLDPSDREPAWDARVPIGWGDGSDDPWDHSHIDHPAGAGLPALFHLDYRFGGPLMNESEAVADLKSMAEDWEGEPPQHPGSHYLRLWIDTAYSYRDEQGRGCGQLHADVVAKLGLWLDEQAVRWSWKNEFTGEIWSGEDRYERLIDLGGGGDDARAWFTNVVEPAIRAEVES